MRCGGLMQLFPICSGLPRQHPRQRHPGVGTECHHTLRCRLRHHAATGLATVGAEVYHPVGLGNQVQVRFNYHHAVALPKWRSSAGASVS